MHIAFRAAAAALICALPYAAPAAELERLQSPVDVAATIDALEAAATEAGATVFARVDHAQGAQDAGMELAPATLLVFGNPKLGTPAMQADPRAGLVLPMRMLAYEDAEGRTWLVWEEPEESFDGLNIPDEADYVAQMEQAMQTLAEKAVGAE